MEDEKIIDLYFKRSESALAETSIKYGSYCKAIANNILSSYEDSEECENDAYRVLWERIPPEKPSYFKGYLGKIVRNLALTRYEYNTAKKRNSKFHVVLSELEECIPSNTSIEEQVQEREISKEISTFLKSIDKEKRIIFVKRYWYSDSIEDIALHMGISESKVKSILFRIRKKLKIHLEREGYSNG